jgi:hypothetical protein
MTEKDLLFERLLDLADQVRLETNSQKMTVLVTQLNEVLIKMLDLQNRERLKESLARAAKSDT